MIRTVLFLVLGTIGSLISQTEQLSLQKQIFLARDKVLPALVHIEPVREYYTRGEKQHALVTGSGVIFSAEGYVLTNHHVAVNASKVWCTLSNKERITAEVIGSDKSTDIAVLKLNLAELTDKDIAYAVLGNSGNLEVGQMVLALGSPLGLSRSVSMGVISSIDRYFPDFGSMISPYNLWIQTDAAINPGNSGGPLINLAGEVVGINARAVFLADNLGFAIPINLAKEVAEEIIQGSSVKRAWLGMEFQEIKDYKEFLEKPDFTGVLVSHVEVNSPAAKAGIKPGDVLLKIGGSVVNAIYKEDLPAIRKIISHLKINEKVSLSLWRNKKKLSFKVLTMEEPFHDQPEFEAADWGMVIKSLSWHIYRVQSLDGFDGVYVTSVKPGSSSEVSKIRNGDVIRKINDTYIKNDEDFKTLYSRLKTNNSEAVFLELIRNGHPFFAVIKPTP